MRQETEESMAKALQNGQKYDESCKEVFKNREVIAPILKYVVSEFKDCTQEEIIRCIDADSIREEIPVGDLPPEVKDQGTEMEAVFERSIRYDIHFKAKNPVLSDENILVMIHVDFEVQNNYRPTDPEYPVVKRAVYYAAREISSQLGKLTEKTNYADIEKCYSIWVCNENVPQELQNTVTRYSLAKEDMIGTANEPKQEYDLMEVVIIRRAREASEEDIFQYLESVFRSDLEKMREYVDIPSGSEIEKEVVRMTGMGQTIYENGIRQGLEQGREQGLEQGREQGETLLGTLIGKLFADGRTKDAEMAALNEAERKRLYREYGLID